MSWRGRGGVFATGLLSLLLGAGCKQEADVGAIEQALHPLYAALPEIAGQAELLRMEPEEGSELVKAALEPHRQRIAPLGDAYRSLPQREQRALFARLSRQHSAEIRRFYLALSRVTAKFPNEEEAGELLKQPVAAWQGSNTMWVFEMFALDTVKELSDLAEGEEGDHDKE
jgi:hypothetical protein